MDFSCCCWLFFQYYYLLYATMFAMISTVTASTECSRELSRQVRKTFVQEVYPQLSISPEQLPVDCELNPLLDKFRIQEKQKNEVAMADWQCKICGKRFVSEYYLDRHMDNKHLLEISSNATYCLAELCPMVGCTEPSRNNARHRRNSHDLNRNPTGLKKKKFLFKTPCNEGEAVALRNGCQNIAQRCFGNNSIDEAKFKSKICNQISCKGGFLMGIRNKWKNNDTETMIASRGILVYIFKFMFAFFVIAAIVLQVSMSTTSLREFFSWQRLFRSGSWSSSSSQSRDAVAEFERRRLQQMKKKNWASIFLSHVLSAFQSSNKKLEKQK